MLTDLVPEAHQFGPEATALAMNPAHHFNGFHRWDQVDLEASPMPKISARGTTGDHLGTACSGRSRRCPACIEKQNGPLPRSELRCHLPVSRRKDTSIGSTIRHLEGGVHCPESSKAPKSCADSTRRKNKHANFNGNSGF